MNRNYRIIRFPAQEIKGRETRPKINLREIIEQFFPEGIPDIIIDYAQYNKAGIPLHKSESNELIIAIGSIEIFLHFEKKCKRIKLDSPFLGILISKEVIFEAKLEYGIMFAFNTNGYEKSCLVMTCECERNKNLKE